MISIEAELSGVKTVGITGHIRPDGDCTGSTLGLYNYIKDNMPEIDVDIYLEPVENCYKFLRYSDCIKSYSAKNREYDVFVVLDCGDIERTAGFVRDLIRNAKKTICIDHHETVKNFATINHVIPKTGSASEVLYELLDENKVSKAVAECLYVGIINDTGVFKYQSTTSRTMEIAGKFMNLGIDFTKIIDDTFYRRTYMQTMLVGHALSSSVLTMEGKLIYSFATKALLDSLGLVGRDAGVVIDQLRFVKNVEVALFMYELPDGQIKGSLRSVDRIDVNCIANQLGGGGHMRAAGFTSTLSAEEIVAKVEELMGEQL